MTFVVSDSGIGIAPDELGHLFKEFWQSASPLARGQTGTGLGLAISRRLCEIMGGTIEVSSELGVGTRFTVWLPDRIEPPRS